MNSRLRVLIDMALVITAGTPHQRDSIPRYQCSQAVPKPFADRKLELSKSTHDPTSFTEIVEAAATFPQKAGGEIGCPESCTTGLGSHSAKLNRPSRSEPIGQASFMCPMHFHYPVDAGRS